MKIRNKTFTNIKKSKIQTKKLVMTVKNVPNMQNIDHQYSPTEFFQTEFLFIFFKVVSCFQSSCAIYRPNFEINFVSRSNSFRTYSNLVIVNSVNLNWAATNFFSHNNILVREIFWLGYFWADYISLLFYPWCLYSWWDFRLTDWSFTWELLCGCFYAFCLHLFYRSILRWFRPQFVFF